MLPVVLGGMALFGAGFVAKKIYDENQVEIEGKIEEGLEAIAEWFDTKTEAINNYAFSKSEKPYQVEEEINLESLQQMKKEFMKMPLKSLLRFMRKLKMLILEN